MKKERVAWIDVARGIGIIFVVYGHALSADTFRFIIYAFHMPLFFFLSGLVFTYRPEQKFTQFLTKNTRTLLSPYILFAVLSFIIWIFMKHPSVEMQMKQFLSIFYGNGNNGLLAFNNLLWFLPCLFMARLGFYLLTKISLEKRFIILSLILLSVIGYTFSVFFPDAKLFFGTETALTAVVFLGTGFLWVNLSEKQQQWLTAYRMPFFAITLLTCIAFAVLNYNEYGLQIDLRVNRLNNYVYFYIAAFAGTAATIHVSQKLHRNRLLEYLGRHTLELFVWHLIVFSFISQFLSVTGLNTGVRLLPGFISPIFYSACSMVIILVISAGIRRVMKHISKLMRNE